MKAYGILVFMTYAYPFGSAYIKRLATLVNEQDYTLWSAIGFDLQAIVETLAKPIIEIAGPTRDGYYFLNGILFNSKPIITNISRKGPPFHSDSVKDSNLVTKLVDARNIPYKDISLSIILCSGLTSLEHPAGSTEQEVTLKEAILALETEKVALGTMNPRDVKYAQRILFYTEAYRTLELGGLLFMTGTLSDIKILQGIGFTLKCFLQERLFDKYSTKNICYEFVVQK